MVIPCAGLLGLGSKLYPSNMPRMLKKDLTRFMPILSRVRENRASERKTVSRVSDIEQTIVISFSILPGSKIFLLVLRLELPGLIFS